MARSKSTTPGMTRINLYITERQHKLVTTLSRRKGVSFSEALRTFLDLGVEQLRAKNKK